MGIFGRLLGFGKSDTPELSAAIERAVDAVEPRLKQTRKYPAAFRKPVMAALEYAHDLARSIPGPITADLDAYSHDAFVHAIFPSMDIVSEAFRTSRAMQEYLQIHPETRNIYALIGMRRREKTMMGLALSGDLIQHDVPQQVVYFTSHTVENPAPSEAQAREHAAYSFFDRLVSKVAERVSLRKQKMVTQQQEKDILMARLHSASAADRPVLAAELSKMLADMQKAGKAMDLHHYPDDFEAVLLNPENHLLLRKFSLTLDSMGIQRDEDADEQGKPIEFNELIGYDRRDWTVAIVYCHDMPAENFAERLETAYRRLSI